jgi:hypothetical protein
MPIDRSTTVGKPLDVAAGSRPAASRAPGPVGASRPEIRATSSATATIATAAMMRTDSSRAGGSSFDGASRRADSAAACYHRMARAPLGQIP